MAELQGTDVRDVARDKAHFLLEDGCGCPSTDPCCPPQVEEVRDTALQEVLLLILTFYIPAIYTPNS